MAISGFLILYYSWLGALLKDSKVNINIEERLNNPFKKLNIMTYYFVKIWVSL